jgi:hypothetical protein
MWWPKYQSFVRIINENIQNFIIDLIIKFDDLLVIECKLYIWCSLKKS